MVSTRRVITVLAAWLVLCGGPAGGGIIEVLSFKMATDAQDGFVLTCDAEGVGTWRSSAHDHFGETWTGAAPYGLCVKNSEAAGQAIRGEATGAGDQQNFGGFFRAYGETGVAVHGRAVSSATGTNYGGDFEAAGTKGIGVSGEATHNGDVTNFGGLFKAKGKSGRGAYGLAEGSSGTGVYGYATDESGATCGVYGRVDSPSGHAGYFTGGKGVYTTRLGTTDDNALELVVNDTRALRLEPHATSPNVIGGHTSNSVAPGVYAATIGGGGSEGATNEVTAKGGTVCGGADNAAGWYAVVGGAT